MICVSALSLYSRKLCVRLHFCKWRIREKFLAFATKIFLSNGNMLVCVCMRAKPKVCIRKGKGKNVLPKQFILQSIYEITICVYLS